jgi:chromosomal replication initiator protein
MQSPQEIWGVALAELQIQVSKPNYETWLKDTKGIDFDDDRFLVSAPNAFVAEWLKNRFSSLIKNTLANVIGKIVEVHFLVQAAMQTSTQPVDAGQYDGGISIKTTKPFHYNTLNSKFTFDNFITGKCNELAYTASQEVVMEPGQIHNPLFIYSDTGLGKSHLLQAIGNSAKTRNKRVMYTNADLLTREFVTALKSNKIDDFNEKYRNIDMLLLDDFQFFGGKKGTQQCFFHLFNDLQENGRQVVITCDSMPKDMQDIGEKLKSRLEGGLVADIKPPDYETRLAILECKARKYKVSIPKEVLEFVATHLHSNIRELEGGLNRIITYARLSNLPVDIEFARKSLVSLMDSDDLTNKESSTSPMP